MNTDDYADEDVLDFEPESCWACMGEGYIHDCGEDTCCCADPETQDMYPCDECGGRGWL